MIWIRSNARADKSAKLAVKVRTIRFEDKNEGRRLFLTTWTAFINESRLTEFTLSTEFVAAKVKAVIGKGLHSVIKLLSKRAFVCVGVFVYILNTRYHYKMFLISTKPTRNAKATKSTDWETSFVWSETARATVTHGVFLCTFACTWRENRKRELKTIEKHRPRIIVVPLIGRVVPSLSFSPPPSRQYSQSTSIRKRCRWIIGTYDLAHKHLFFLSFIVF